MDELSHGRLRFLFFVPAPALVAIRLGWYGAAEAMGISALTDASGRSRPGGKVRRWLARGLLGGVVLTAGGAGAAESGAPEGALVQARRQLLERAKERFEAGRGNGLEARQQLEGALDALRLAYQLAPAPWLLFNLAQVKSRLGACQEATELYQRFLASQPAPEARASAEQAMELLGQCTEPAPLTTDDGLEPGLLPPSSLALVAQVADRSGPAALSSAPAEPAAIESAIRPWPWIFGGLALSSAVAAAFFYSEAVDAKDDLDRLQLGGPLVAQTQQRGESAQAAARVLGGFTLGFGLATGVSLWPWRASSEAPAAAPPQLGRLRALGAGASYSFEF